MEIQIEKLGELVEKADKIFITAEGEQVLVDLLDVQRQVEEAIDTAKKKLEETALKINPNFTSIQADKIKVYYRTYGAKYRIDESHVSDLPKEFFETKQVYSANSEAIDQFVEKKGA